MKLFKKLGIFLPAALWVLAGCASRRVVFHHITPLGKLEQKSLDQMLWEHTVDPGKDVDSERIVVSESASYHLIRVQGSEKPHVHETHDLAVFVLAGTGVLFLGDGSVRVGEGSVIFIPQGKRHYFVNTGPTPAVAVAVFSPPYDGKDEVPAPENIPSPATIEKKSRIRR